MENIPWVEKYRPTKFDKIVLNEMNRQIFKNILERNSFPNLLFYGPPGTGKTTTIINLINEYQQKYYKIDKSVIIHLNASDERGIDIVRNQICTFVKSNNLFEKGIKFVILDEVDYMTKTAQQAFKYLLQSCNDNVKFCLICNYISKVDESLQNEFICIRFNQLPPSEIYSFIEEISYKENLNLDKNIIESIQKIYKSDIRSIINFIQLNQHLNLKEWSKSVLNNSVFERIHSLLLDKNKNTSDVKNYINKKSIQYNEDKKSIIQKYLNYIIRDNKKRIIITREYLFLAKTIIHNTDVRTEDILNYFCINMKNYLNKLKIQTESSSSS
jgi:replication factor C subunit 3/5